MKCKDCYARNDKERCLIDIKPKMLVCGHYGCDLQGRVVERRMGITNPQTNADCIRSMTDKELANFLWSIGNNPSTGNYYLNGKLLFFCGDGNGWLDWLKQEAT